MTVQAINPSVQYTGNGATSVFSYLFEVTDATELVVTQITISSLQRLVLTQGVDYTVDVNAGTVTYLPSGSPMSSSYALEIRRNAPYEQEVGFTTQGPFSPTTIEAALDYLTLLIQQVNQWLVGSTNVVRLPTHSVGSLPSALTAAPALIYVWNASGGGIPCFSDGTNWRRVDTREVVS